MKHQVFIGLIGLTAASRLVAAETLSVPGDFATIQAAVDAAVTGDEVFVAAGEWVESVVVFEKAITIRGEPGTFLSGEVAGPAIGAVGTPGPVLIEDIFFTLCLQGAIATNDADIEVSSCSFANNQSITFVGAAASIVNSDATFTNCSFFENSSPQMASTISITGGGTLRCEDCSIIQGESNSGSAVLVFGGSAILNRVLFLENRGSVHPSLVATNGAAVTITNSLVRDPVDLASDASGSPFGILNGATMKIFGCTFIGARTSGQIGGNGTLIMGNSIVPSAMNGTIGTGLDANVQYCLIEGGFTGEGNINGTPVYDADTFLWQLDPASPGVDAANAALIDASVPDFYGNTRVIDDVNVTDVTSALDMGCAERVPPLRYVNFLATGRGNGQTWDDAYTTVIDAIEEPDMPEPDVEEIWVAQGEYAPDRGTGDRDATFALRSGLAIHGGFEPGDTSRDDADPRNNVTVLTGKIAGLASPDNTRHVVSAIDVDSSGVLDGFHIVDGYASGAGVNDTLGAALFIDGGGPSIRRCVIRRNNGDGKGYVVRSASSDVTFDSCRIELNGQTMHGLDAVRLEGGRPTLRSVAITGNQAESNGALFAAVSDEVTITNVTVAGNVATSGTLAGVVIQSSDVFMRNTIIGGNISAGAQPAGLSSQLSIGSNATIDATGCSVEGYVDGLFDSAEACDDRVPRFVNARGPDQVPATGDEDFRLEPGACAIDSGFNAFSVDTYGDANLFPRIEDDPGTADTGDSDGAIKTVDRGAYEFQTRSCKGDINEDESVGFADLTVLLNQWGNCATSCAADLDCTGSVDFSDLVFLLGRWGECPQN